MCGFHSFFLQVLDSQTDITYQVSAAGGGGVVASRDFVVLRHWEIRDSTYVSAGASIEYPNKPSTKQYIRSVECKYLFVQSPNSKYYAHTFFFPHPFLFRGENLPGCWAMKPIQGDDSCCVFQWLLNTNLNGWLPQYVVDSAFTNVMLEFLENLRAHAEKLRKD